MKVLVICAHADDEVIAIGGTLRKLANAGAEIRLLVFSDGAEGYTTLEQKDTIVATRAEETDKVCDILGIAEHFSLHALDWDLKVSNESYHVVIHHIRQFRPDLVLTHSRADYSDHVVVHDIVVDSWFHAGIPCAMCEGDIWGGSALYEFEVLQAISAPTVIVDITDTYAAKVEAMGMYTSQHELVGGIFQLMEGRALERGSQIGVKYGEALARNYRQPCAVRDVGELTGLR